jgi:hypothetical protein
MKVFEALDRIDWNFPRAGTSVKSVHSLHWFPGNFIPQIPIALIQVLSKPGDVVFDPFGGSGTTAVEAIRLGRRAVLSDRVSACALIAQAKLDIQTVGISHSTRSDLLVALTWRHQCHSNSIGVRGEGSDPSLANWFAAGTLSQLRFLWQLIERQANPIVQRILVLLFSDVLFACASPGRAATSSGKRRRHHWGWVADNVLPRAPVEHDAIGLFEAKLANLPEPTSANLHSDFLVVQQDARQLSLRDNSVDLVVTSPPYVSVIDYTKANRLLYLWLNWSFDDERGDEIGARYRRRRLSAADEYVSDMRSCWKELSRVLRPGGHCAIVIGESRSFIGAVDRTMSDLSCLLLPIWGPTSRTPSRRRVSDRNAHQAIEYLYVFKKP